jgi:hypothetical protein
MRRAARRDKSEPLIIEALRAAGCSVERVSQPVDLLIGYRGRTYLAEVKTPRKDGGRDRLQDGQSEFIADWRGAPVPVFRSVDDALWWMRGVCP